MVCKFGIIMPSFLGAYKGAASQREDKLERAIWSVLEQTYAPWHLCIIADGCDRTMQLVQAMGLPERLEGTDNNITLLKIDKQPMFSGTPRNTGIEHLQRSAEWICYLDADDFLGPQHLESLSGYVRPELDWLFFDDYTLRGDHFRERPCHLSRFKCGTSNIAHRATMRSRWQHENHYGYDDWTFTSSLKNESQRYARAKAFYLVCHIPNRREI